MVPRRKKSSPPFHPDPHPPAPVPTAASTTLVLDNGGGTIKAGLVSSASPAPSPRIFPNALARPGPNAALPPTGPSKRPYGLLAAGEITSAPDFSAMSFRRPHDRGFIARWDAQRDVWAAVFAAEGGLGVNVCDTRLLLTEPLAAPEALRIATDELVFETFGFREYGAVEAARLVAEEAVGGAGRTCLVVDSGFSFTHAVPVVAGRVARGCAKRLNVGGKALTNHLKEMVSFRSWNMMEETAVVNAVKERMCFVSPDFLADLRQSKRGKGVVAEYVLPDLSRGGVDPLGHVRVEADEVDGTEQIMSMDNERYSVPEVIFCPGNIGLRQAGIAALVVQAVEAAPEGGRADLYGNIVLVGGNCGMPGFRDRFYSEVRPLVPDIYEVRVVEEIEPLVAAFFGGVKAAAREVAPFPTMTKNEYEEHGSNLSLKRFGWVEG